MTYYPNRWEHIEEKREAAEEFVNDPTRDAFVELVDHPYFWATRPRRSIDYYVDDIVFADQTPEQVADAVRDAVEDADALEPVLELDGFGWATATELLHVLVPDTYAILNKRAVAGMEALGYGAPSPQTASTEEYWAFVDAVKEASETYDLRGVVNTSSELPSVPDWATDLEAADSTFNAHYDDDVAFNLTDVREAQRGGTQLDIPDDLETEIGQIVAEKPTYRDLEDFVYSAIRRELERAT